MKEILIKALMVEPLKQPKEAYIPNKLKYFERLVNQEPYYTNTAEILILENNVGILRNKDGALLDLKGNRKISNEIIAGIFFVIGIDEKGLAVSLPDDKIEKYCNRFKKAENYTDIEVLNSYWDKFEEGINELEKLCK